MTFVKPLDHEEFLAVLGAAKIEVTAPTEEGQHELPHSRRAMEPPAAELCPSNLSSGAASYTALEVQSKLG